MCVYIYHIMKHSIFYTLYDIRALIQDRYGRNVSLQACGKCTVRNIKRNSIWMKSSITPHTMQINCHKAIISQYIKLRWFCWVLYINSIECAIVFFSENKLSEMKNTVYNATITVENVAHFAFGIQQPWLHLNGRDSCKKTSKRFKNEIESKKY